MNRLVFLKEIPVYHLWTGGQPTILGTMQSKEEWVKDRVDSLGKVDCVMRMLTDWELYEKGWVVRSYRNSRLFYYLSQIGGDNDSSHRPEALQWI